MAAVDCFLIPSSPYAARAAMSSSPLPTIHDLLPLTSKASLVKDVSHAVSMSTEDTISSTSHALGPDRTSATFEGNELSKSIDPYSEIDGQSMQRIVAQKLGRLRAHEPKLSTPRKKATRGGSAADGGTARRGRKPKHISSTTGTTNDSAICLDTPDQSDKQKTSAVKPTKVQGTSAKGGRKPRAKKDGATNQARLPTGKVTKTPSGGAKKKCATASTSNHCSHSPGHDVNGAPETPTANDLLLQAAVKRRTQWTPPKMDIMDISTYAAEVPGCEESVLESGGSLEPYPGGFSSLLTSFEYKKRQAQDSPGILPRLAESLTGRKRKLIELVTTNKTAPLTCAVPPKSIKKKPRTITELAIAAYAVDVEDERSEHDTSVLLQQQSPLDVVQEIVLPEPIVKRASKSRSRSPIKTAKSKAVKSTKAIEPLLTPDLALQQARKQEFVFGTSSQLAREESPTLLRDLHNAMTASNHAHDDQKQDSSIRDTMSSSEANPAKKSLWAAASHADEWLDIDTVDLTHTPVIVKQHEPAKSEPARTGVQSPSKSLPLIDAGGSGHGNPSVSLTSKRLISTASPILSLTSNEQFDEEQPKRAAQAIVAPKQSKKVPRPTKKAKSMVKPNYESYTTAQLAKEIAAYHFKPIKRREAMISLLEKCWESKQSAALSALTSNPVTTSGTPPGSAPETVKKLDSPARRRGRPTKVLSTTSPALKPAPKSKTIGPGDKKTKTSDDQTLVLRSAPKRARQAPLIIRDEISDSDTPPTPSPPRRLKSQSRSPPAALPLTIRPDIVIDAENDAPDSPISDNAASLHKHITWAVLAQPRTTNPAEPSWHEKILLYDPIVLEDLAAWLNSGALSGVGWDGEVKPKEVKEWCIERSICCLWRVNFHGGTRQRW